MEDFYRELIIERFKTPHFRGKLDPNDITYEDDNPTCGDHIRIDVRLDENQIVTEAVFSGEGCAISQASADLMLESIIGKSIEDVKELAKEDILEMLGIELGPTRLKCALLPLKVLKAGVYGVGETDIPG
ncbi:MAG: SUF system NifU family Fe-S cluster assembly protein [Anaerolineales bacterium]